MNRLLGNMLASTVVGLLLISGCAEGPVGPRAELENLQTDAEHREGLRLFTGRDSFGVAFQADVSGTWIRDGDCFELEGSGNATHLGRIDVTERVCVDGENDVTESSFTLVGRNGRAINGHTLFGSVTPTGGGNYEVALKDTITGESIPATQIDPEQGKGDVTGTLSADNRFEYRLVGWLLHRLP